MYKPTSPSGACLEAYSRNFGDKKHSAKPCRPIPRITINVIGCSENRPKTETELPVDASIVGLSAMLKADSGMMNKPIPMAFSGLYFRTRCVIGTTRTTTTNGLMFASHSGLAPSPSKRRMYLLMVAYSCPWTTQKPATISINAMKRAFLQTLPRPLSSSATVFPVPFVSMFL